MLSYFFAVDWRGKLAPQELQAEFFLSSKCAIPCMLIRAGHTPAATGSVGMRNRAAYNAANGRARRADAEHGARSGQGFLRVASPESDAGPHSRRLHVSPYQTRVGANQTLRWMREQMSRRLRPLEKQLQSKLDFPVVGGRRRNVPE